MNTKSSSKKSGPVFVVLLLAAGLLASGLTWWNYERRNFSTKDAVWVSGGAATQIEREPETPVIEEQIAPGTAVDLQLEADQLRGEIRLFQESLEATRATIDDAVVMVQEQTDNFEFARDRYETLMPLVETGALEPLAASQIQSAYISARASLAQAKFLLSQARRDFGTSETRIWRYQAMQNRLQKIERELSGSPDSSMASHEELQENIVQETAVAVAEDADPGADERADSGRVLAVFHFQGPEPARILPGMQARVTFPATGKARFRGIVDSVETVSSPSARQGVQVMAVLTLDETPAFAVSRTSAAAQVTIDSSLPIVATGP